MFTRGYPQSRLVKEKSPTISIEIIGGTGGATHVTRMVLESGDAS